MQLVSDLTREELNCFVISLLETLYRNGAHIDPRNEFKSAADIAEKTADALYAMGLVPDTECEWPY